MQKKSAPLILRVWMIATWCLAVPMALVSRYLHRRMGADPSRFSERLGRGGDGLVGDVVWFHAASLGEVKQIGPLAAHLHEAEGRKILVTTTTATSAQWVAREMPFVIHRFAPIDTPAAVRRFVAGWSLTIAIFVEGDLWPRMLGELHANDVPRVLLNARHSRTRDRLAALYATLLVPFSLITCRSQGVADGIVNLGVDASRVRVLPDLRLTLSPPVVSQDMVQTLSSATGVRPVWLAASTHPADEKPVLIAHRTVFDMFPDALCIIAPRHPSRGAPLRQLCADEGFTVAQRSLGEDIAATTQVYIADTLGELGSLYTLVPVAFVGGSFGMDGGHTPYEPAVCDTAILYGPNVANFSDAYAALTKAGGAVQVATPQHFGAVLTSFVQTGDVEGMGRKGLAFMETQYIAIEIYAEMIKGILMQPKG